MLDCIYLLNSLCVRVCLLKYFLPLENYDTDMLAN